MAITVIERKDNPTYKLTCGHCRSVMLYHIEDVVGGYVKCPVCNTGNMADTSHLVGGMVDIFKQFTEASDGRR